MKIGIAEDEYFEREAIKLLIARCEILVEIAFETDNGADAVLLFRKHRPDLILIDIEMPVLSGLDAVKKIREIDHNVEIVILTAYNAFEYAQQAIKMSVMDYLLKPYNSEKFYEIIRDVEKKLLAKKKENDKQRIKKKKMLVIDKYLRKELLHFMVAGRYLDPDTYDLYNEFLSLESRLLKCVLFRISKKIVIEDEMSQKIQTEMERVLPNTVCSVIDRDIICIRIEESTEKYKSFKIPKQILSLLPDIEEKDIQMSFDSIMDIKELPYMYQRLKEKVNIVEIEKGLRSKSVMDIYRLENELYEQIIAVKRGKIHESLIMLSKKVDMTNKGSIRQNRAYFSYLWRGIDRYIFQVTGRRKSIKEKNEMDIKLEKAKDINRLIEISEQFIYIYSSSLSLYQKKGYSRLTERAKEYIKENIADEISLEKISEELGYSSTHFSKTFKKVEGINFKKYVMKMRMEMAKSLFLQGQYNVSEVSMKVGYQNANYFSKVFYKYYGILPREFVK